MKSILFFLTLLFSFSIHADDKISIKDKDLMGFFGTYAESAANMKKAAPPSAGQPQAAPELPVMRSPRQDFRKNFQRPQSPLAPEPPRL